MWTYIHIYLLLGRSVSQKGLVCQIPAEQHPPSWKLALYCRQADNKGADADPHASRYCDGDHRWAVCAVAHWAPVVAARHRRGPDLHTWVERVGVQTELLLWT
jgi:hypothetical protein